MIRRKEQVQGVSTSLFVSYMEIYKEEVYDLLVDRDSVSSHSYKFETIYLRLLRRLNSLCARMNAGKSSWPTSVIRKSKAFRSLSGCTREWMTPSAIGQDED
jgi:hypothetical protein